MGKVLEFSNFKKMSNDCNCDVGNEIVNETSEDGEVKFNGCLYILIGIPCSGKSTYAKKLLLKNPDIVVIATDEIRKELTGIYKFSDESNYQVFEVAKGRIQEALSQGRDVVFDATNTNKKYRSNILSIAKKNNSKAIAIVLKTPLTVCLKRNSLRDFDRIIPEEIIITMAKYDSQSIKYEGFEEIIEIKT